MLPSRWRGGDPAAVERTARCRSGGSLSITAAPPPHGGDPKPAPALGAVPDASTGTGVDIHIQDGGRRLHKLGIPVEASRPTAADGFGEASVAPDGHDRLPSLPRHPSLMQDQMGSGQSPAFCLPVVNGLVASAPAGGACGGRDAYHHGKTPGGLLLLLAATRELPAKASVGRSWSRLPLSIVRACFLCLILLLICAGGSCTPILKSEFTIEFCPLNTSETCSVPLSHPFKRPIPIHSTWLTEQVLEARSERIMLQDQKPICNNSQSLDFRIVSMGAPIISFVANLGPLINVYGIGQVNERGKQLFAISSMSISISNFFWRQYQQTDDCPNGFIITILLLAGLVYLGYTCVFCLNSESDVIIGLSLSFIVLGISVSTTIDWKRLTASILGLICMGIGHIVRVATIRRYHIGNVIFAFFGLFGGLPVFYRWNWQTQPLFMISTLISSGSRFIDFGMQFYYYRRAPNGEDDAHVPPLVQVVHKDIVQGSNQFPVPQGVHDALIGGLNVAGEVGDGEGRALDDGGGALNGGRGALDEGGGSIAEGNEGGAIAEGRGAIAEGDAIAEGGGSIAGGGAIAEGDAAIQNGLAGALDVDIDQEVGNGGAREVVADAQVAIIQNAPAPAGPPDAEVATAADAE